MELKRALKLKDLKVDGQKIDIFTLGINLFMLAYGTHPFTKATTDDELY